MNIYQRIHDNLVNSHRHLKESWKPIGSGLARHRIVPAHQGGTYEDSNCTYLTHREHLIAHWLLWKINGHEGDKSAWQMMTGVKNYPSTLGLKWDLSDETRAKMSKPKSAETRAKMSKPKSAEARANMRDRIFSPETRAKMSAAGKGRKCAPFSAEHRAKISAAGKGRKLSPESRAKMSATRTGKKRKPFSPEARANMSAAQTARRAKETAK